MLPHAAVCAAPDPRRRVTGIRENFMVFPRRCGLLPCDNLFNGASRPGVTRGDYPFLARKLPGDFRHYAGLSGMAGESAGLAWPGPRR